MAGTQYSISVPMMTNAFTWRNVYLDDISGFVTPGSSQLSWANLVQPRFEGVVSMQRDRARDRALIWSVLQTALLNVVRDERLVNGYPLLVPSDSQPQT